MKDAVRHPIRVRVQLPKCCEVIQDFHLVWSDDQPNLAALECGILPDTGERHTWWMRLHLLREGRYRPVFDPASGHSCEPSLRHPTSWTTLHDSRLRMTVFLPTSGVGLFLSLVDERRTRQFEADLQAFGPSDLDALANQLLSS